MPLTISLVGRALALSAVLTLACSSTSDVAGPGGKAGNDAGPTPLVFSPCTLLTDPAYPPPPSGALASVGEYDGVPSAYARYRAPGQAYTDYATAAAECATARMPAIWSDPKGASIDVFVKRVKASKQPAKAQLWMLTGGPGYAGPLFEPDVFLFAKAMPDFDIYLPDFRGTGKSTFAACASDAAANPECTDVIPPLGGLTVTNAAKDLAALIDASQTPSEPVFILGVSYGTYWAQRYLQIRPNQPAGVILDSAVPMQTDTSEFDVNFDENAHSLLELCKSDATCSAKLGPDPVAKANEALAAIDAGTCGLPGDVRVFLGEQTLGHGQFERSLFPASIYRILRCNAADLAWFDKVNAYFKWWGDALGIGFNGIVVRNIVLSENWPSAVTKTDIETRHKTQIASSFYSWGLSLWLPTWPRYPEDEYMGKWPTPSVPILTLQGTLDPRTPYGDIMKAHYTGKNQYYVEFPGANHGIDLPIVTPMVDPNAPGCGWQVIRSFLEDPTKSPDISCVAGMAPIFADPPKEWFDLVGIQDLWENP